MQHTHRTSALRSRPPSPDSEIENERRFTVLEYTVADHSERHDAHQETHSRHDQRFSLIERAILGLYGAVYILAQDRFPEIAKLLRGMLP